jgi:hypothetical protein
MQNRFESAIKKLVKAYFNNTLTKGDCKRCGTGTLVGGSEWADAATIISSEDQPSNKWKVPSRKTIEEVMSTNENDPNEIKRLADTREKEVNECIEKSEKASGYSIYELLEIEQAFEQNTNRSDEDMQYKGLCAVFEKLCELDGIEDPEPYKLLLNT